MRTLLLILVLSSGVCAAQTPAVCPWFSTGSAENVLSGTVALTLHVEGGLQGMCRFTRTAGSEQQVIEINIGKVDTHACPSGGTKLTALGNEAVQCRDASAGGQPLDVIAGRVRDIYFVVSMGNLPGVATVPTGPAGSRDSYSASVLERVAEQVVGNLY
jgi:hypothetical protein